MREIGLAKSASSLAAAAAQYDSSWSIPMASIPARWEAISDDPEPMYGSRMDRTPANLEMHQLISGTGFCVG